MGHTIFTVEGYGSACVEIDISKSDIIDRIRNLEDASKVVIGLLEKFPESIKHIYGYLKPEEKDLKIFPKPKKMRAAVVKKFKEENKQLSQFL